MATFSAYEIDLLNNRLPIAAIRKFIETLEKENSVVAGTYLDKVSFANHADTILACRLNGRDNRKTLYETRVKNGLSKPAEDYVPTGNEQLIADPMNLSPIIPEHIRKQLSEEVKGVPVQSDCEPALSILPLVRNSRLSDNIEEHKESK